MSRVLSEAARRRTFAVISHPDAGKSTLDRGARPARLRHRRGGRGARQGGPQGGHVGLDGDGAEARHLHHLSGAAVRLPRPRDQPARHPRPRRLLRGHLPGARRRRRGRDAARRGEGPRAADAQAVRRLPLPQHPRADVRQQVGPPGPRGAGAARRGGADDRPAPHAGHLAARGRGRPARRARGRDARAAPLHPHRGRGHPRRGRDRAAGAGRRRGAGRLGERRRTSSRCSPRSAPRTTRRTSSRASPPRCCSARRCRASAWGGCWTRWSTSHPPRKPARTPRASRAR